MARRLVMIGSLLMFLGVAAGAFGAHGLSDYLARFPELGPTYNTAVRYHLIHGLAVVAAGLAAGRWSEKTTGWAGYLFASGVLIFSGSLYLLVFTRLSWLGAITPLGGAAFLAGWAALFLAAWQGK